jgi:L-glyceraldehyde 3-phosphate reductase
MTEPYRPADDRYDPRPDAWFRRCGHSGLMLPAISLGCWHNFGDAGTDSRSLPEAEFHANARAMLFTAFDHGVTHFDLANNYGPAPGSAELRVGRILREDFRGHRDELILSTKAGYRMWPGPYGEWGSRKSLLASLDQSLQRMGVDYVDLYYSHRPDPAAGDGSGGTPLEETLGALDTAVRQGKALYTGISSYPSERTSEAVGVCERDGLARPIIHQPNYSMLNRGIEADLLPVTQRCGMGVIAFCPLAQGLLTDKYLDGVPEDSRAKNAAGFLKEDRVTPELIRQLQRLNEIARDRGQSLAQMALSWVLRDERVTTALIGASRPGQIEQNVAAAEKLEFADDELQAIEAALSGD